MKTPARRAKARRQVDPVLQEVRQILKPILGPAREKAELLVEHLATRHRLSFKFQPTGLGDAVRRLRAKLSDDDIRAGAQGLVGGLAKLYGDRETVV